MPASFAQTLLAIFLSRWISINLQTGVHSSGVQNTGRVKCGLETLVECQTVFLQWVIGGYCLILAITLSMTSESGCPGTNCLGWFVAFQPTLRTTPVHQKFQVSANGLRHWSNTDPPQTALLLEKVQFKIVEVLPIIPVGKFFSTNESKTMLDAC